MNPPIAQFNHQLEEIRNINLQFLAFYISIKNLKKLKKVNPYV